MCHAKTRRQKHESRSASTPTRLSGFGHSSRFRVTFPSAVSIHTTRHASATESRSWTLPSTLCIAFLLLGLATIGSYGVSWDEPLHRGWGQDLWQYLLTGDEQLLTELPGGGQYYGPLFYILEYGVSRFAHEALGMPFTAANHLLTLVTATLGLLCTFLLAETLSNRRAAAAATMLLFLLPPFLAHAHYNPKDIPLLTLATAALLFGTWAYRHRRDIDAVLCGIFLGCAIAMKPTAVVLLPVIGGALIADMWVRGCGDLRAMIRLVAVAAVASIAGLLLGWPTLWRQPGLLIEAVRYFAQGNFWTGNVLYFRELTLAAELPWHYTPVMLMLSTPLLTLLLAVAGAVLLIGRALVRAQVFAATLVSLWIILPLLLFMKPGLPRYDGMRQIFFVVPAIAILGGIGWDHLWRMAARSATGRVIAAGTSLLIVAWLMLECVRIFPYGGSYVNAPARALLGPRLEHTFEIEYWGVAYREGARWLQHSAVPNSVVCVPVAGHVLDWQDDVKREDLTYGCTPDPQYVMLITRFSEWPDEYHDLAGRQPVFTVSRYRSDLIRIYDSQ